MTSTIKVNNIQNQCGANIINENSNTITIGASGDTIALASGASQSGFGRNGSVNWQTAIKTSTITAANGEGYFVDTSSGALTANLPAGSVGAIVAFKDYAQTFDTNALTIAANGSEKIEGITNDLVLRTEGVAVTLVYGDATKGWQAVNSNEITNAQKFIAATGGTVTTVCTNFKVHTFTGPGTFCVSCVGNPAGSDTVSYVVVAGGGGGGGDQSNGYGAGGGGAGGFRESKAATDSYTASPLNATSGPTYNLPVSVQGYPIAVGGGGAAGTTGPGLTQGTRGVSSSFSTITSTGGGGGDKGTAPASPSPAPGGSGGGGSGPLNTNPQGAGGTGNTPPVSPPQGNAGGAARTPGTPKYGGGGGGGATAAGENFLDAIPGNTAGEGGAGATSSINGTPTTRAGGGGGGPYNSIPLGWNTEGGAGGSGGGGAGGKAIYPGTPSNAVAGTVNTGGGGGGAASNYPSPTTLVSSAAGGSGIVIIRYKFQ